MSTPSELRETARVYRETAEAIYQSESREHYHTALNHLYEATRRELYARMLEGKEKELQRCIELHPKVERQSTTVNDGGVSVKDVRGRYKLFSTPYAERKEESERKREQARQKERAKPREGFKELPSQFTFKL